MLGQRRKALLANCCGFSQRQRLDPFDFLLSFLPEVDAETQETGRSCTERDEHLGKKGLPESIIPAAMLPALPKTVDAENGWQQAGERHTEDNEQARAPVVSLNVLQRGRAADNQPSEDASVIHCPLLPPAIAG